MQHVLTTTMGLLCAVAAGVAYAIAAPDTVGDVEIFVGGFCAGLLGFALGSCWAVLLGRLGSSPVSGDPGRS